MAMLDVVFQNHRMDRAVGENEITITSDGAETVIPNLPFTISADFPL
jgi:hypothetical protein